MISGSLFTRDYLAEGITKTVQWAAIDDRQVEALKASLLALVKKLTAVAKPNEAQTEKILIYPALEALGWADIEVQQILSPKGRKAVPDALLFGSTAARNKAVAERENWKAYRHGLCILEAKRWLRLLDRSDKAVSEDEEVPSTKMLQYLSRVDIQTSGKLRLGILTNGEKWRLYFQGALSVSEDYFEIDLAKALGIHDLDLFDKADARFTREHCLKLFLLMFGRDAFLPADGKLTFHDISRNEGKLWEERVTQDLSALVFTDLFPKLVTALAAHDPGRPETIHSAYLDLVRQAALVLLYRLLFVVYAEDRDLLPDNQEPYKSYSLTTMRLDIADRKAAGQLFSAKQTTFWPKLLAVFRAIAKGDDELGIPPYNGGLFAEDSALLLHRAHIPDAIIADVIFTLSHRPDENGVHRYINYRDLSVQQLGTIYERTLEYGLKEAAGAVVVNEDDTARHESGSYYTPDSLVSLIIDKAVGPFIKEKLEAFRTKSKELATDGRRQEIRLAELQGYDPAMGILELKVCDPAMGSGHFLVNLVDFLADKALAAIAEAETIVDWSETPYRSPILASIEQTRADIVRQATVHKWPFVYEHLDDRHIVRRTVLKRCIYGVDKNAMAVELAKVALWLHTFTVGAPLSFLDHHLRCGNSLFGYWIRPAIDKLSALSGELLLNEPMQKAMAQALAMQKLERVNDIDIAEVTQSKTIFDGIEQETRPLNCFLQVLLALSWVKHDHDGESAIKAWLDGQFGDPFDIARGKLRLGSKDSGLGYADARDVYGRLPASVKKDADRFVELLSSARDLIRAEGFHNWQVAFPGVWDSWNKAALSGGFDAVIGNPPYVRQELIKPVKPALKMAFPETFDSSADLYVYFYDQGLSLLKPGGRLSYTVTNKWLRGAYGEKLRAKLTSSAWVEFVADFGHAKKFFPDADVFPTVLAVRKPTTTQPPKSTDVVVIPRDEVPEKGLETAILNPSYSFRLPRAALTSESWVLEREEVLKLMDKIRRAATPMREYLGAEPLYGLKTGFNEAFLIGKATRDALVADDPSSEDLFAPYLRGEDVSRWSSANSGLFMIMMKSSENWAWPWADAENDADAEKIFKATYPALHRHFKRYESFVDPDTRKKKGLRHREDQGRFWWELRSCAYYDAFAASKIIYQVIQYHPRYSLDTEGRVGNDKTFILPTDDLLLLAILNSPLMWWFNWRNLVHLKDEALSPMGYKMSEMPVASFSAEAAKEVTTAVKFLIKLTASDRALASSLLDWLRIEFAVEKPKALLDDPAALTVEQFISAVKDSRPRPRELSANDVSRLKVEYAKSIAPAVKERNKAVALEARVSDLVNAAYGLSPKDVELMWATAPVRMPIPAPKNE